MPNTIRRVLDKYISAARAVGMFGGEQPDHHDVGSVQRMGYARRLLRVGVAGDGQRSASATHEVVWALLKTKIRSTL